MCEDEFIDLFKPDPAHDKITTMSKTQKGLVKQGEEIVAQQDKALWIR